MSYDPTQNVAALFSVGVGLVLAAAANLCLRRRAAALGIAATFFIAAGATAGAMFVSGEAATTSQVGIILAGILTFTFVVGSSWLAKAIAAVASWARRPAVRWSIAAALGIATIAGSLLFDDYLQRIDQLEVAQLELGMGSPITEVAMTAATDRGRDIELRTVLNAPSDGDLQSVEANVMKDPTVRDRIIRTQPAVGNSNCFGWVFAGGRYWVSGDQVKHILAENGYQQVDRPQSGDLAIYRSGSRILHAAVVRYVAEGRPVLVEGKWGCVGVYLHEAERSIYGSVFAFYRSPRSGHLLAGLEPSPPPAVVTSAAPPRSRMALAPNDSDDGDEDEFIE